MQSVYIKPLVYLLPLFVLSLGMNADKQSLDQASDSAGFQDSLLRSADRAIDIRKNVIRYLYHKQPLTSPGTPVQIALEFLSRNRRSFGIENPDDQLILTSESVTPGGTHLVYRQHLNGIPVYQADMTVTISGEGHVAFLTSRFRPDLTVSEIQPAFDKSMALEYAQKTLQIEQYLPFDPEIELMVLAGDTQRGILIYHVRLAAGIPRGDWEVLVNAQTGVILQIRNRIMYDAQVDGTGAVWNPDPLTAARVYYGGPFTDPDGSDMDRPELNAQRLIVPLRDITEQEGKYFLHGPFVSLVDIDSPGDIFPTPTHPDSFIFTRAQQGFECVMVYYHIDSASRYLHHLGFDIAGLKQLKADPHGVNGEDNSYYMGTGNFCAFGEGGVDDAEDASVIWHEFAHAIQENIGGMEYIGETAALQEGCSDYWAASYSRSVSNFAWEDLFIWDAGKTGPGDSYGAFWQGRRCDLDLVYPFDYDLQDEIIHKNGQIWSSALMHIWEEIGREITDRIFIEAHYLWGASPGFPDAAKAFIQADSLLYDGIHTNEIIYWFDKYGLILLDRYIPIIVHEPLPDCEDLSNPPVISAVVYSQNAPLDSAGLWVHWDTSGTSFADSTRLIWNPDSGYFQAKLPAVNKPAVYRYYLRASDMEGRTGRKPGNAPDSFYSHYNGTDYTPPDVWHDPLPAQALVRWPPLIWVRAWDNIGVDSVIVEYGVDTTLIKDRFAIAAASEDSWYHGPFSGNISEFESGQQIFYRIKVTDKAASANATILPDSGFFIFELREGGGTILLDSELDESYFTGTGDWQRGKPVNGPGSAFAGNAAWGTKLTNAYTIGPAISSLISSTISLKGFQNATFSMWQWYDIEPHLDGGNVKISSDQGATWEILVPVYGYETMIEDNYGNPIGRQPVISGEMKHWHEISFSLDRFAGEEIQIRFDFGSNDNHVLAGWFLDSLTISDSQSTIQAPRNLRVIDNKEIVSMAWDDLRSDTPELPPSPFGQGEISGKSFLQYYIHRSDAGNDYIMTDSTMQNFYRDSLVLPGRTYQYFITAGAGDLVSHGSDTVSILVQPVTVIENTEDIPDRFALFQNYPNPFNPVTTIRYQIPVREHVKMRIFDINGRLVNTLIDQFQSPGRYAIRWASDNSSGQRVASGIYLVHIEAGRFTSVRKIILLK